MAAVGMLAPFYESLFFHAFQGIRKRFYGGELPQGHRAAITSPDEFWDCHFHYDRSTKVIKKDSVFAGINQLAKAVGLKSQLPGDLPKAMEALLQYRNYMFHNGFEWPQTRRYEFMSLIEKHQWHGWFSWARRGGEPWVCCMTADFVNHSLDLVHRVLDALGALPNP